MATAVGCALILMTTVWIAWRAPAFAGRYGPGSPRRSVLIVGAVGFGVGALALDSALVPVATVGWVSAAVDARTRKLPLEATGLLALGMLSVAVTRHQPFPWQAAAGAVIWLLPLAVGYALDQVGLGDVPFGLLLGAWLGSLSLTWAVAGLCAAFLATGTVALATRKSGVSRIPLGPFLWGGAMVVSVMAVLETGAHLS